MSVDSGGLASLPPVIWIKAYEGGTGDEANDFDVDYYAVDPVFSMGDLKINPHLSMWPPPTPAPGAPPTPTKTWPSTFWVCR